MDAIRSVSPIVWELGLTVVGLIAFVVWQAVTLRRDRAATQREKAARAAGAEGGAGLERTAGVQEVPDVRGGAGATGAADASGAPHADHRDGA